MKRQEADVDFNIFVYVSTVKEDRIINFYETEKEVYLKHPYAKEKDVIKVSYYVEWGEKEEVFRIQNADLSEDKQMDEMVTLLDEAHYYIWNDGRKSWIEKKISPDWEPLFRWLAKVPDQYAYRICFENMYQEYMQRVRG